jgi:predicted transcriptional regulator YheO
MRKEMLRRSRQSKASRARPRSTAAEAKMKLLEELVPQLARAMAPSCEVALHDAASWPPVVRAIGNGHVSLRKVGDRMTRVGIGGRELEPIEAPLFNYVSRNPEGQQCRTSLLPIRHAGAVIGYLAVNFLVQDLLQAQQVLSFLVGPEPQDAAIKDPFDPPRSAAALVDEYLESVGSTVRGLGRSRRIDLIRQLHRRGAFALRGAVEDVARKLGVSRTTIYNYLTELGAEPAKDAEELRR